jgi:hypothetical protein
MIQRCGGSCMSERKSHQWVEKFQEGRISVVDHGKLILILFWDMNRPILERYMEKGKTVNSVRYSTMLEEKPMSKGVLLHGNAQPHAATATVTTIQKLKSETINHPHLQSRPRSI